MEQKPSREGGRGVLVALFVIYLVLLAWMVLWKLEVPFVGGGALREIAVVPFASEKRRPFEVVVNLALFVPFGLYLGLLAPSWRWWRVAVAVAGASVGFELAQYMLAIGTSDVADVIDNTAGGLAGFGLLALARRRLRARTVTVMTRICCVATVVALLIVAAFVVSPLRYGPHEAGTGR